MGYLTKIRQSCCKLVAPTSNEDKVKHRCFCLHVVETLILLTHLSAVFSAFIIGLSAGGRPSETHDAVCLAFGVFQLVALAKNIASMCTGLSKVIYISIGIAVGELAFCCGALAANVMKLDELVQKKDVKPTPAASTNYTQAYPPIAPTSNGTSLPVTTPAGATAGEYTLLVFNALFLISSGIELIYEMVILCRFSGYVKTARRIEIHVGPKFDMELKIKSGSDIGPGGPIGLEEVAHNVAHQSPMGSPMLDVHVAPMKVPPPPPPVHTPSPPALAHTPPPAYPPPPLHPPSLPSPAPYPPMGGSPSSAPYPPGGAYPPGSPSSIGLSPASPYPPTQHDSFSPYPASGGFAGYPSAPPYPPGPTDGSQQGGPYPPPAYGSSPYPPAPPPARGPQW